MKTQRRFFNIPDQTHSPMPKPTQEAAASAAPVKTLGILKPEGISRYIGNKIESTMHQHFTTHWEGKKEVKVYPLVKAFTLTLVCSIYHRALKAAAAIRKKIQFLIKEKIDVLSKGQVVDDLISLVVGAEQGGKYVPRLEISNIIMGLMNFSHMPIAITQAFMIKHIGQRPAIYQKILSEYADIKKSKGSNAALDWDSRQKLKYTWVVAQETMRLYPTAPGALREAITDITYEGFTIPKGWEIFCAFIGTNKNPKYFDEPESFDPSRFEGNVPVPYTWIPFGAGPRTWPGKDYARLVVLNFIHILITKFHLGNYTFSQ
ncbi:Beta-amyrin 28-monooxygenase [Glycine soja]|uniref:Beta-amyrin 28-monooxygenase n=1 Tax=Glycine soja TaxID=3848 RepID=A0A445JDY4_GLYSO|nr:Beta-amyrin 28-monooxygenase [Glycine soja]